MIEALNMKLESVRTVLRNDVNEITVCIDLKRTTGTFYTIISIISSEVRRQVAGLIAISGLFTANNDFIGSFSQRDTLNLVFLYHTENRLSSREAIFGSTFVRRKQMAESLLVSCAETQITGSVGLLLLNDRNINISPDGIVYFNYFLDFKDWKNQNGELIFYQDVSQNVFDILSRTYSIKYDGQIENYPRELQVFFKKTQLQIFQSFNSILTFIKMIPDQPREPYTGIRKLLEVFLNGYRTVKQHSMGIFLFLLFAVTLSYAGYQIALRVSASDSAQQNTSYQGMEYIGEVYLGDENA